MRNTSGQRKVREYRESIFRRHVRLADVVPLAAPFTILADPANACNFKCTFCPTGDDGLLAEAGRPKGTMKFDLFEKIVEDTAAFGVRLKKFQLHKDGEPLLNKRLPDMIALAKARDVAESVEVTTNGSLLTPAKARALIDSGLDVIRVSIEHVDDAGYRAITRTHGDYGRVLENVRCLHRLRERLAGGLKIYVKIFDSGLTAREKRAFLDDFSAASDFLNIEKPMGWSGSQGRTRDFTLGLKPETAMNGVTPLKRDRKVCSAPFKSLAVNFNGEVSVCCVDWRMDTVVGDVRRESLLDIWRGERLREFRMTHLTGRRKCLKACATCQYVQGLSPHEDLDSSAARLIAALAEGSEDKEKRPA